MDKKRKIILVLIIVLSLFLVAGVGLVAWFGFESSSYSRHIARAEKYIALGDYNHAALEYQAALDKQPQREEIYKRLAEVYTTMGQNTMAKSILQTGAERTGSASLTDMLYRYLDDSMVGGSEAVSAEEISNEESEVQDGDEEMTTVISNSEVDSDKRAESGQDDVQLIIDEGVYDYHIIEEVIGKECAEGFTWIKKYFGDNIDEQQYADVHFLRIHTNRIYNIYIDGYLFPIDRITVSLNDSNVVYDVSFEKIGYNQNLYDRTCSFFESKFGIADDVYVGNREDVQRGMWVCDDHTWKKKINEKNITILQCFSNFPNDDHVCIAFCDESLADW